MVASIFQNSLASKVRNYLKTNNIPCRLQVNNGLFTIDNAHTYTMSSAAELCESITGVKFESIGLSSARIVEELTLQNVLKTSETGIGTNKELKAAEFCNNYVTLHGEGNLSYKHHKMLWDAAFWRYKNQ